MTRAKRFANVILLAGVSTLASCATMPEPETPYIICADNATDCGDEIDVEIVGNFSPVG